METAIRSSVQALFSELQGEEILFVDVRGETSDFVRFNRGKVRQPGTVEQWYADLKLVQGQKHADAVVTLSPHLEDNQTRLGEALEQLRERVQVAASDPYLLLPETVHQHTTHASGHLPNGFELLEDIGPLIDGIDFVGILAAGSIARGAFDSRGGAQWYEQSTFNLDSSLYHSGDKAIKQTYAGLAWDREVFRKQLERGKAVLPILSRPPKKLEPGHYRTYLAPAAVAELLGTLSWGGFGLQAERTKQSIFLQLQEKQNALSTRVSLSEAIAEGPAAPFGSLGFTKPDRVPLIAEGQWSQALVSPRSGMEYQVPHTGAGDAEMPEALSMQTGQLASDGVLKELGTGLYINNLWYLNFSDRPQGRITGMTRFATFWVENGEIVAPVDVMRFDDTVYRMLGSELEAVGQEATWQLDAGTYGERNLQAMCVPGLLLKQIELTL